MEKDARPIESNSDLKGFKPYRRKIRVRLFIFLMCLAISGSMWVFIELMKDYTTDLTFAITFKNVPNDLILVNQTDSTLVAGVNAQGFELWVAQYLSKRKSLEIDLSEVSIRQGVDGYTAFIASSQLIRQISGQLNYSKSILYIKPDTLFFRFSEIYRKRVPVLLDFSYTFADQYQLYDSVRFSPGSIVVSSIKNVIDTIRFVKTQHVEQNDLDSSLIFSVPLRKSLRSNMLRYSQDSVTIKMQVGKYTEAVFNVPIKISGNILPIRIFPDQVEVSCMVPLSDFKGINADDFSAEINASPEVLINNKRLTVNLTKLPSNIRSVRVKPDQVEYIIIAK